MASKWQFRHAGPIYIAQLCAALMPLVVAPVVIRSLGLEVFGLYATLMTASQLGLIISEYSFDAVGPRILAESRSSNSHTYCAVLSAKLPLICIGAIFGAISFYLIAGELPNTLEFVGISFVIMGSALLSPWFLIATGKIYFYSFLIGGARIVSAFTIILSTLVMKDSGIDGSWIFVMYATPVLLTGCLVLYQTNERPFAIRRNRHGIALLRHGFPAFLGTSAISIQNMFGQFIIGLVAGPVNLGVYNAIDRPARTLSASLKPIFQTLYPHVVALHRADPAEAQRFIYTSFGIAAALGVPVLLFCALFSKDIIGLIYGADLLEYHFLFVIIVAWLFIGVLNNFAGIQGLQATGRDKVYSAGMWLSLLIAIVGSFSSIGLTPYSFYVATSIAAGELAALTVYLAVMWRANARCSQ